VSEEPEELSEQTLNTIFIVYMVAYTVIVMVSLWYPYVAVGAMFIMWLLKVVDALGSGRNAK
jgi:hypothetical protein